MHSQTLLGLILTLPFAAAALIFLLMITPKNTLLREKMTRAISIIFPALTMFFSLILFFSFDAAAPLQTELFSWLALGELHITITLLLDPLSLWMVLFITLIATLIFIYAAGYMDKDPGYSRFFIYFHLFLGSMLLLVLADNPVVMFIGWEGVGLCSYLLIGFYTHDKANIAAANKAFFANRIGDFGFIVALALLFITIGTAGMDYSSLAAHIQELPPQMLQAVALLLFVGAMGKSAQIPLYVWLPDAMAGPTPVSALIHAATMVTAGVYMVARFAFLYTLVPDISLFIAYIGTFSALIAALFASFENDIKKILAYSTMSQLGFMFIAVGLGDFSGALFHLFTHAFFKALLFMGAGAVIIALHHEQNIFKMGSMKHFYAPVYVSMFFATLAISGIPPFSGFISKDAILAQAFFTQHYLIWGVAAVTSLLTAYYMFRLFFTVFVAASKSSRPHVEAVPFSMQWPLIVLAIGAVINGIWNLPHFMEGTLIASHFLNLPDRLFQASSIQEWQLTLFSAATALLGAAIAYQRFSKHPEEDHSDFFLWRWLRNKFYIDQLYAFVFVRTLQKTSQLLIDYIEPAIIASVKYGIRFYHRLAFYVDTLQSGDARSYMIYMMGGVFMLITYLYMILEVLS